MTLINQCRVLSPSHKCMGKTKEINEFWGGIFYGSMWLFSFNLQTIAFTFFFFKYRIFLDPGSKCHHLTFPIRIRVTILPLSLEVEARFLSKFRSLFFFLNSCVCVFVHVRHMHEGAHGSQRSGITDGCEPSDVGAKS